MFDAVTVGEFDKAQVLVIGRFAGDGEKGDKGGKGAVGSGAGAGIESQIKKFDKSLAGAIRSACSRAEGSGEAGKIAEAFGGEGSGFDRVLIVGLGKKEKLKAGDFRTIAASVARRLATTKETTVIVNLGHSAAEAGLDVVHCGRCFGEGAGLLSWNNVQFKGKGTDEKKRTSLKFAADRKPFAKGMTLGVALAEATNLTRTLSETPPNVATPQFMAEQAKKLAKSCGLTCEVLEGKDLEKERLAGHINVGKASENKPRFIRLSYTPANMKKGKNKPIVLIGKTVTYDTGGLSLKVNNGMVGMKRDKDGGCAVLGAMKAIATVIKPGRPVVAYLCAAENSVSDVAYRPDDIITYRNGVTVEVTNTDAEGRLVLADGFCYACDKDDPHYIVELSTLTGGVITALGSTFAGMFCDDDALRAKVEAASEMSGERVWRLPMHSEYRDMMKSPVADILNSNPNRKAHAGQGAAFLSYFVKEGVRWCHLDIAGVHVSEADAGPWVKGSAGWGVRLLCDLVDGE